jgi:Zn-dependent protease/CBS domain-containing protein
MFGTRWRLFRLFGIPIGVDASWLIILVLITWTLADGYFRAELPSVPASQRWVLGLLTALAFFLCIVLHEMGHALVARTVGMPIRGITLFLFGGVAELGAEPPSAGSEFLMAIAGPVVSAILAGILWLLASTGAAAGWTAEAVIPLAYLSDINFLILIFNLVPAFPLDGGRVFRSVLWAIMRNQRRATYVAALVGRGFAWFLIAAGVWIAISGSLFNGLWIGLIGLFLNNAAMASYQQILIRQALEGEPVDRFMNRQPIAVPPDLDLRTWVEDYVYRYHRKTFPVVSGDRLVGMISTRVLAEIPRAEWERRAVGDVMRRDLGAVAISPRADAMAALTKMQRTGQSRLLITEGDRLVGIVSLKDLLRFLQLKIELGGDGDHEEPPQTHGTRDREEPAMRS